MSLAAPTLPAGQALAPADLSRSARTFLILLVIAVAVLSRLAYLTLPFDGDAAMFVYMGRLVIEGGQFGVDLIDNKFPTVGLVTAAFWLAFGVWWPGYVITQLILALSASALLSRRAADAFGEQARWPCFLACATLLNLNAAVMGGFQLETLQSFFACIGACCALSALNSRDRRDALACGLAAGVAMLLKPTGASVLAAFALACMLCRSAPDARPGRAGLLFGAGLGFSLPTLTAVAYLHWSGQLELLPAIAAQIGEYARNSSFAVEDLFRPVCVLGLFGGAMLIRGWVYRRERYRVDVTFPKSAWAFALCWITLEFIGVVAQRRMYAYHFLPLAAPAALVFAALPRRPTVGQLAGVLCLPVTLSAWGAIDVIGSAARRQDNTPAVAGWLDRHTSPGERVWRDITPQLLLRTDLRPASKLQLTFLFMNADDAPTRYGSILIDDLRRSRPRYVVLPADIPGHIDLQTRSVFELARMPRRAANFRAAWEGIDQFVKRHYTPAATVGNETIWQRREVGR